MSKEKYPNIFSTQMEAIALIILQIFFATRVACVAGGMRERASGGGAAIFLAGKAREEFASGEAIFPFVNKRCHFRNT